jgi:predicted amidohydrolase
VLAVAGADPHLLLVDVDLNPVEKARATIAVLRNRAGFAQSGRAQSQA